MPRDDDDDNPGMPHDDDLATLWFFCNISCIMRPSGSDWHVRLERDGVTLRERTVPNSQTAIAIADEWEAEITRPAAS